MASDSTTPLASNGFSAASNPNAGGPMSQPLPTFNIYVPPTNNSMISPQAIIGGVRDTNFVRIIHSLVSQTGITMKGKAIDTAFRNDDLSQLFCSICKEKIHKKSCTADFTIRVIEERTQTAMINCHNIVCETCYRTATAQGAIHEMMSSKGSARARSLARFIVSPFAPLIRVCFGSNGVIKTEHVVDLFLGILAVLFVGWIIYYFFIYRG